MVSEHTKEALVMVEDGRVAAEEMVGLEDCWIKALALFTPSPFLGYPVGGLALPPVVRAGLTLLLPAAVVELVPGPRTVIPLEASAELIAVHPFPYAFSRTLLRDLTPSSSSS
jgi:hypothetical protein